MRDEIVTIVMTVLMLLLVNGVSQVAGIFEINEILVSLTFSLVFTFAIGLEVVGKS